MEVTFDFNSAPIKTEPVDDYPQYETLAELGLLPKPDVIFHADIKTEPVDEDCPDASATPPVPDEPQHLIEINFMNPMEPTDLSMPKELFSDLTMRTPSGRLYIDNGTRLKCKICAKMCRSKH